MGERYSVPFFFSINYDADVKPLPERAVGVSKFMPMRAGEYVLERLRATTRDAEEEWAITKRS
jgi:isopenicillin N synthase-like dioxygenase